MGVEVRANHHSRSEALCGGGAIVGRGPLFTGNDPAVLLPSGRHPEREIVSPALELLKPERTGAARRGAPKSTPPLPAFLAEV